VGIELLEGIFQQSVELKSEYDRFCSKIGHKGMDLFSESLESDNFIPKGEIEEELSKHEEAERTLDLGKSEGEKMSEFRVHNGDFLKKGESEKLIDNWNEDADLILANSTCFD
jgi:hypothetical protein